MPDSLCNETDFSIERRNGSHALSLQRILIAPKEQDRKQLCGAQPSSNRLSKERPTTFPESQQSRHAGFPSPRSAP